MAAILDSLIILGLLLLTGFAARKLRLIDDHITVGLSSLMIFLALPARILMSLQRPFEAELLDGAILVFVLSVVIQSVSIGLGFLACRLFRIKDGLRSVWILTIAFCNVGYMGIPFIGLVIGDEGVFYCAIYNIPFTLLMNTLGIAITRRDSKEKTADKTTSKAKFRVPPALVASIVGVVLFVCSVGLPRQIGGFLDLMGEMSTPLAMIIIGGLFAKNKLKPLLTDWKLYILAAIRLLVIPTVVFLIVSPFITDKTVLSVVVYLTAMPAAAIMGVFAVRYGSDAEAASNSIVLTTAASALTLPIVALLLK